MERFICQSGQDHPQLPGGITDLLGLSQPEMLHLSPDKIAAAALAAGQGGYVRLPFCSTLAAEGLGVPTVLTVTGAMAGQPPFSSASEVPAFAVLSPRMRAMLSAVDLLSAGGERVIFQVDGPLTILAALLPMPKLFSVLRKPEGSALLARAAAWAAEWAAMAANRGAVILSYADPVAALDILGERTFMRHYRECCLGLLERLRTDNPGTVVHLCGKMTQSLLDTESCTLEHWRAPLGCRTYGQTLEAYRSTPGEKRLVGHWCLNLVDSPRVELALITWKERKNNAGQETGTAT